MTLPTALASVVDLQHAHRDLLRVVDSLTPADWDRGVPYGEWTVKDFIAYVIGDLSPSGPGLIGAGVLTPAFIAETSAAFDVRAINQAMVDERRRYTAADLRQLLFEAHDARIEAALRLDETDAPALEFPVPMGDGYEIKVEDWLWYGYHDREATDDIKRALKIDWTPRHLTFIPEIEAKMAVLIRSHAGFLRAVYSVADDAWDEAAADPPGWTYKGILAHIASNEWRRQVRLLSAAGEAHDEELAKINDVDAWNEAAVAERRTKPVAELVDEYQAGWNAIREVLARFKPEHLANPVTLGGGETIPANEFLDRMGGHTSRHAGQLVPASRRARLKVG